MDEGGSEDIDSLHFEISLRGAGAGAFSGAPEGERYDSKQDKGGDGGARAFSGPHQRERYERKPSRRSKTEETNPNQRPRKTPARPHPDRRPKHNDTNTYQRARKMPPPPLRAMCFQNAMCLYLPSRLHPLAPRCCGAHPDGRTRNAGTGTGRSASEPPRTAPNRFGNGCTAAKIGARKTLISKPILGAQRGARIRGRGGPDNGTRAAASRFPV